MHDIHFKRVVQHFLWPTNILARSKITPPWYMTKSLAGIVDLCWTKPSHRDGARSRFDVADCLILMHYCSIGLQSSLHVRDWNSVSRLLFFVLTYGRRGCASIQVIDITSEINYFLRPKLPIHFLFRFSVNPGTRDLVCEAVRRNVVAD